MRCEQGWIHFHKHSEYLKVCNFQFAAQLQLYSQDKASVILYLKTAEKNKTSAFVHLLIILDFSAPSLHLKNNKSKWTKLGFIADIKEPGRNNQWFKFMHGFSINKNKKQSRKKHNNNNNST